MEDKVLETVINGLEYTFEKDILVKPLDPIMVTTEFTEQVPTGEKDEEGFNVYETKTETKEIESDFAKGIILALPETYEGNRQIGDIIVYPKKFAKNFDIFKDSQLVKPYDIVATVKK